MKKNIHTYIDYRLELWADWCVRILDFGLGYPRQSLESKAMQYGGVVISGNMPKTLPTNADAEEIETLICDLAKQNLKLANALRVYYLEPGPIKSKAKKLSISYSQFKVFVDMGKQWITGRLTGKYKFSDNQ